MASSLWPANIMNFFRYGRRKLISEGRIGDLLYCHTARNGWEGPQPSISWKRSVLNPVAIYTTIHELDLVQSIMGIPEMVTMAGGNVAHQGENLGMKMICLLITLEFPGNRYALLEYGSPFAGVNTMF